MSVGSFLHSFTDRDPQQSAAVAVVIPTMLRPSLARALESVFAQDLAGTIQILIGVDTIQGDLELVERICRTRPANCIVQAFYPGYSTATRHGGLYAPADGGALRALLTTLANSRYVAYLDDDNWWASDHLSSLHDAISPATWAFSLRWFVHPLSNRPICIDSWESVGPDKGVFAAKAGGFVDPNTLMIDKLACAPVIPCWNHPLPKDLTAMSADRTVFAALRKHGPGAATNRATAYYRLSPNDSMHPLRLKHMGDAYDRAADGETEENDPRRVHQHSPQTQ